MLRILEKVHLLALLMYIFWIILIFTYQPATQIVDLLDLRVGDLKNTLRPDFGMACILAVLIILKIQMLGEKGGGPFAIIVVLAYLCIVGSKVITWLDAGQREPSIIVVTMYCSNLLISFVADVLTVSFNR